MMDHNVGVKVGGQSPYLPSAGGENYIMARTTGQDLFGGEIISIDMNSVVLGVWWVEGEDSLY